MTRAVAALWGVTVVLVATAMALGVADRDVERAAEDTLLVGVAFSVVNLFFAFIGALLAARRPRNPLGWMFLVYGLIGGVAGTADGYAEHALLAAPGSLPAGSLAAWLADFVISGPALLFGFFVFLFLLFPHGRLPSPRWRPAVVVAAAVLVALQTLFALEPGPLPGFPSVQNPLAVSAIDAVRFLEAPLFGAMLLFVAASAVSLVRRFQAASGDERQQLKWIMTAGVFLVATILSGPVWCGLAPESVADQIWPVLFALALTTVPLGTGIAILRYRLYDIDVVINRTLVYGVLTATLVLTYVGSVLVLQLVLRPLTEASDLAIAGSTLAVAAVFRPLRGRIQGVVDRRFYRRRYDAQRTLEAFAARLRDELDLDSLSAELRGVVRETMQPAHVSLWLRGPGMLR